MKITIQRDEVTYGPYSLDQVKQLVAQRRFGYADKACIDGANQWQTVENLIIQDSFRRQRAAYISEMNSAPKKKAGGKHANRWLWKPSNLG